MVDWNQAFVLSQRREGVKVGWRLGVTGLVYQPNSKSKSVGLELDTGFMDKSLLNEPYVQGEQGNFHK